MSALRISRPGIAGTTLIPLDDGASPRIDRARSGISFTPLTEAIRPFAGMTRLEIRGKPGAHRKKAMTVVRRCGRVMRGGEQCYRRANHQAGECKSRVAVEWDNARRRARDYGDQGREDLGRARAGGGATDEAARALPPGDLADD